MGVGRRTRARKWGWKRGVRERGRGRERGKNKGEASKQVESLPTHCVVCVSGVSCVVGKKKGEEASFTSAKTGRKLLNEKIN